MDIQNCHIDSFDGTSLFCRFYKHPFPRGAVLIVHGEGDHSGRYDHVAEHLVASGFYCVSYDQRCHGQSSSNYHHLYEELKADLGSMVAYCESLAERVPIFLLGQGAGAALVAAKAASFGLSGRVRGAILSAAYRQRGIGGLKKEVFGVFSRVASSLDLAAKRDFPHLSRDPLVAESAAKDPLYHKENISFKAKMQLARRSLGEGRRIGQMKIPALILHGTCDKISSFKESETIYERIQSPDKTFLTYDGYYHEILNEYGKEIVLRDITDWLLERSQ